MNTSSQYLELPAQLVRLVWPTHWKRTHDTVQHCASWLHIDPPGIHYFAGIDESKIAELPVSVRAATTHLHTFAAPAILGLSTVGQTDIWIRLDGDAWGFRAAGVAAHETFHVARNQYGATARTDETKADEERSADRFAARMLREIGFPLPAFLKGKI